MSDGTRPGILLGRLPVLKFSLAIGFLVVAMTVVLSGTWLTSSAFGQDTTETHVVEIRGFEFHPPELTVHQGDTITWINRDPVPHTATSDDGSWDSGTMSQRVEWVFVADAEGTFDYLCTFHPQMTGMITVVAN